MSEVTAEMIERGRGLDPRSAVERRRLNARVRETRERLTSTGTGHRAFDIELLNQFAASRLSAAPAMVALAVTIGAISSLWVPIENVVAWLSLVIASVVFTFIICKRYLKALDAEDIEPRLWQRVFIFSETSQGVVWALLVLLLLNVQDDAARTFVFFVLLLVAAMSAMMSAPVPQAVYGGLLPITIAIIAFMHLSGSPQSLPLAMMAAAAQIYFVVLAKRLYSSTLASLSLRVEKDLLIGELEQAKANSDEARRRAEEANLAKSRFLATMSHELRTPLNAILGFSEVMKGELFGQHSVPSYKEYSNDIHNSGQHLLMLINEILDLSRVEAGRYELKEEPVSLPAVVEDCKHLLSLRAEKRGLVVVDAMESDLPRIWADERAVRQVTLNLLTNAIKFTPQGGSVTIKVGWTAIGGQYLSIRDTGTGIPPEEIPIVMSSFGRGSMAQKNADEGSGLGLPIVKGLVELHGGTFQIRSQVRVGTEVIVIFPPERVMNALPQLDPNAPPPEAAKPKSRRRRAA